jgi:hypothetical protein
MRSIKPLRLEILVYGMTEQPERWLTTPLELDQLAEAKERAEQLWESGQARSVEVWEIWDEDGSRLLRHLAGATPEGEPDCLLVEPIYARLFPRGRISALAERAAP